MVRKRPRRQMGGMVSLDGEGLKEAERVGAQLWEQQRTGTKYDEKGVFI
jgi:hypothetical protein